MKAASIKQQLALPEATPATDVLPPHPILPLTPDRFDSSTPQESIIQSDIDLTNAAAADIYRHWCQPAKSLRDLAKLFKLTVDFTKHRRKILEMHYGPEKSAPQRRTIVYPVD